MKIHRLDTVKFAPVALAAGAAILAAGCATTSTTPRSTSPYLVQGAGNNSAGYYDRSATKNELHPAQYVGVTDNGPSVMYGAASGPIVDPTPSAADVNVFGEVDGDVGLLVSPTDFSNTKGGFQQHTFVEEGFDADVSVSPDGQWIVYASTRHSPRSDIYLQRVDGLAVTKLTTDGADDAFPTFSPDGTKVAFASNRTGNWDIYTMDLTGKNVTQITRGPEHDLHPSFNPQSDKLVFCRIGGPSRQWELWTADLYSNEFTMVGFGLFPEWSPRMDKDQIAFQRARQRGGRWFSLWTMDLFQGEPMNITEVLTSVNAAIVSPSWSPAGDKLAFATVVDPDVTASNSDITAQDIWTINADGTERQRLTDGKGSYATPCWSENDRIFFVSNRGGVENVWSTSAVGIGYNTTAMNVGPKPGQTKPAVVMQAPRPDDYIKVDRPEPAAPAWTQPEPTIVDTHESMDELPQVDVMPSLQSFSSLNPDPIMTVDPVVHAPASDDTELVTVDPISQWDALFGDAAAPTTRPSTVRPVIVTREQRDSRLHPRHTPAERPSNPLDNSVAGNDHTPVDH